MGLWTRIFGHPEPDGLIGCVRCKMRTVAPVGSSGHPECSFCGAIFVHITTCKECGWKEGCVHKTLFLYTCDGCHNGMCSRLFREMEDEEWRRKGYYTRDPY